MTTLLNRQQGTAVEEMPVADGRTSAEPTRGKPKRLRRWVAGLAAFVTVAAAAVVVTVGQDDAAAPLSYRAIGEVEALERFGPSVEAAAPLSYRAIGEVEALERFGPSV